MKVQETHNKPEDVFEPISIIITLETPEEMQMLYDHSPFPVLDQLMRSIAEERSVDL